jgi:hypothetical protein
MYIYPYNIHKYMKIGREHNRQGGQEQKEKRKKCYREKYTKEQRYA